MKKIILVLTLMLFCSGLILGQNIQKYVNAKAYIENLGYTCKAEYSFYSLLSEGEKFYSYKTFHPGNDYIIVAFSEDSDVQDIDVYLCLTDGTIYKEDTDTESTAVLTFSPAYEITMKTYVKNYSSDDPGYSSRCWVVIGYK